MKKSTLLLMACIVSVMTFAQGGDITYVLNGGVTNDDGWQNKNDMYMGLNQSWNTFSGTSTAWRPISELLTLADPVASGIPTQAAAMALTFIEDAAVIADWKWLIDYMDAECTAQGRPAAELPTANASYLRYNFAAFFVNGFRTGWPISADYIYAGLPEAFIPVWGKAFAGPDSYDGSAAVVIPAPYKAGSSFGGWFEKDDFSGDKVTSIPAGTEGDITLYAKWVDYMPTGKEVQEMAAGETVTTAGTVTYVSGTTVLMQDASAGLLVEFAAAPTVARGEKIIVKGTTTALGDFIKVTGATLEEKEFAALPATPKVGLAALASKVFRYVEIEGLTVSGYADGNAIVTDGTNSVALSAGLSPANFPANTKVSIKAVVCSTGDGLILYGIASDVIAAPVPRPDPGVYAPQGSEGEYTLTNLWLVSNVLGNFTANPVGAANMVRSMTALDGKMYFIDRGGRQLFLVDGATGAKLTPIPLAADIFRQQNYAEDDGVMKDAGTLIFNDIKKDDAGNILVGPCFEHNPNGATTAEGNYQHFQIWKINLEDGSGTVVIDECLGCNPDYKESTIRFDAFGVWGDVNSKAIIMGANASNSSSTPEAYKWVITDGVAGPAELIILDNYTEKTFITGLSNLGTAPQVLPLGDDYFYVDGNATLPTLYDMDGNVVDGFFNTEEETWAVGNNAGHNGLVEFEMGGEYFFLMASMNTAGSPASTFTLFKFKDVNKEFKDIKKLWVFPAAGMGGSSNAYRSAIPAVEVNEETLTANIYVYTGENGYGAYKFRNGEGSGIEMIDKTNAFNVFAVGKDIILSEKAARVKVFNLAGQLVKDVSGVSLVSIANTGIYVVAVQSLTGETVAKKVIIR